MLRPRSPRVGRALAGDVDDRTIVAAAPDAWPWPGESALPGTGSGELGRRAAGFGERAIDVWATLRRLLGALESRVTSEALVFPLAVGIASRIYASFLIALMPLADPTAGIPRLTVFRNPFIQWDSQWYITIANLGYHAGPMQSGPFGGRHDFAFFPGWPLLLGAFRPLGLAPEDIAAPLANILFVLAGLVIFRVFDRKFGRSAAKWGLVLLAFSPPAYVLSMGYSEPLYLLLIAGVFATTGPVRAVLSAAVGITRVSGLALAAASGVRWLRAWRDWTPFFTALAAGVAFASWWIYIWILTGDPMGWLQGSAQWSHTLGLPAIWSAISTGYQAGIGALLFVALILGASIALLRYDLELGLYSILAIGMSVIGAPVESMPRHALAAFPAFGLLAWKLGPKRSILLAIVFGLVEANYLILAFVGPMPLAP